MYELSIESNIERLAKIIDILDINVICEYNRRRTLTGLTLDDDFKNLINLYKLLHFNNKENCYEKCNNKCNNKCNDKNFKKIMYNNDLFIIHQALNRIESEISDISKNIYNAYDDHAMILLNHKEPNVASYCVSFM